MSAHGQRIGVTADLFTAPLPVHEPIPAAVPAPRLPPLRTPPPAVLPEPRARQLWYAAVFPDLEAVDSVAVLQRLSLRAQGFTSLVSIEMPNALLLEIRGSVRLFGALDLLLEALAVHWQRLELRVQGATAPTTLAALWLARSGDASCIEDPGALAGALAALPVACTAWAPERLQTLHSLGVRCIGELLRLPRAGLARRLGPAAVLDLDIALGKQAAPRRAWVSRGRFRERGDFDTEIETVAYLQKAVAPLVERCAGFLRERQAGVQALELRLWHRSLPPTCVRVGLAGVTSDGRRLATVIDERLGRLELPAAVRGMELLSGSLRPLCASSLDAFAGLQGSGRDTAPQLVERLRARLGEASVYGIAAVAEHRPEAAWQRVHDLGGGTGTATHAMPRPVWLMVEPIVFSADRWQQLCRGGLILDPGPERIESGWWDGRGVARDYYIARHLCGPTWWVFQERHSKRWYLHGVFA